MSGTQVSPASRLSLVSFEALHAISLVTSISQRAWWSTATAGTTGLEAKPAAFEASKDTTAGQLISSLVSQRKVSIPPIIWPSNHDAQQFADPFKVVT